MAKVICICGKLCSGKSTYSKQLRQKKRAAVLSVDEITLALFDQNIGDKHDEYVEKTKRYLFDKSVELAETGIDVILDWGFWRRSERAYAREFYREKGIECELHYIDVDDKTWGARLEKRNAAILARETNAYFVDDNLAAKFAAIFEAPGADEIDLWIRQ